jgi:hypothetical protein
MSGPSDEADLAVLADGTLQTLEQTVGIRGSDVILEIGCGVGRVGRS